MAEKGIDEREALKSALDNLIVRHCEGKGMVFVYNGNKKFSLAVDNLDHEQILSAIGAVFFGSFEAAMKVIDKYDAVMFVYSIIETIASSKDAPLRLGYELHNAMGSFKNQVNPAKFDKLKVFLKTLVEEEIGTGEEKNG